MYARHNRLHGAVAVESELAGLPPRLEVCLPGSLVRPADLLLVEPDDTLPTAVDPSVVHPLRLSSPFAEATPGSAAAMREVDKRSSNTAGCAAQGWRYIPVAAETTGGWGPEARRFVRALIRKQSMRSGRPVRKVGTSDSLETLLGLFLCIHVLVRVQQQGESSIGLLDFFHSCLR